MFTVDSGIRALQDHGAKITTQRVAIMNALAGRLDHPSAERIFRELKPSFPSLSIATVYSTARLLCAASLMRALSIDDKRVFFDPNTSPHAHFLCSTCKKLIDVPISSELMRTAACSSEIDSVTSSEIFFYGVCTECASRDRT